MAHRRLIWQRYIILLGLVMLLGFASKCDAAVREYAVISIKIGTASSTSINTGTLVFELWPDLAPKTVQNFKHLANTRFYDGTASHRLIPGFMIQAGDPNTRSDANVRSFGQGGPGYTIPDELAKASDNSWEKRKHVRGILSMAHSNNTDPEKGAIRTNTGGSQFFVMFGNAEHLDGVHSSFGTLIKGSEFFSKIEERPKFSKDTSTFDLINPNGVFEPEEKQLILRAAAGDQTVLKQLIGKPQDQELTENDHNFILNALSCFIDVDGDGTLTETDLNDPENRTPHQANQPVERLEIQSVQVFSIDDAARTKFTFQPTTYSGLLRHSDRSSIVGHYQVSVQETGAVSGVIEFLWLKKSFAGNFPKDDKNQLKILDGLVFDRFSAQVTLPLVQFSNSGEILACQIQLDLSRSEKETGNSISVNLFSSSPDSSSPPNYRSVLLPYSGFSESPSQSSKAALSKQYGLIAYPSQVWMRDGSSWRDGSYSIRGASHFLIRTNPFLGLCFMSGRLADGSPYTASRPVSSEHGANLLPIYASTLDLTKPLELSEAYMQNTTKGLVIAGIELSNKNTPSAAQGYMRWLHSETTSPNAPLEKRFIVDNQTYSTSWTSPTRNTVMKPFSSTSPRGQLMINGASFNFSLQKNTAAVFDQNPSAAKPFLSFDPTTGAFSGVFNDTSISPAKRRNFSGVLLNSTNARGGAGHYLDSNSSKRIEILPIIP